MKHTTLSGSLLTDTEVVLFTGSDYALLKFTIPQTYQEKIKNDQGIYEPQDITIYINCECVGKREKVERKKEFLLKGTTVSTFGYEIAKLYTKNDNTPGIKNVLKIDSLFSIEPLRKAS